MEHSLHKQLKSIYCKGDSVQEMVLGDFRIDVVAEDGTLVEIQHSSLSAIKPKCKQLLCEHQLKVVKPIVRCKQIVKLDGRDGKELSTRQSPKKGDWLSAFEELVYFTDVFPHSNLEMDFLLVDIREIRFPGHGRRRRKRDGDFQVQDLELIKIVDQIQLSVANDLFKWLPFDDIPPKFDTEELAQAIGGDRPTAQQIAYCLREMGAVRLNGKRGRANLYQRPVRRIKKKKRSVTSQPAGKRIASTDVRSIG